MRRVPVNSGYRFDRTVTAEPNQVDVAAHASATRCGIVRSLPDILHGLVKLLSCQVLLNRLAARLQQRNVYVIVQ